MQRRVARPAASRRMPALRMKNALWRGLLPRCRRTSRRPGIGDVGAVELADPVVGQAGPAADRARARLVPDQPQGEVEPQPVARVSVVGDAHVDCLDGVRIVLVVSYQSILSRPQSRRIAKWHVNGEKCHESPAASRARAAGGRRRLVGAELARRGQRAAHSARSTWPSSTLRSSWRRRAGSSRSPGLPPRAIDSLIDPDAGSRLCDRLPYALFDLRFSRRKLLGGGDRGGGRRAGRRARSPQRTSASSAFARAAIMVAWHLAQTRAACARLVLRQRRPATIAALAVDAGRGRRAARAARRARAVSALRLARAVLAAVRGLRRRGPTTSP